MLRSPFLYRLLGLAGAAMLPLLAVLGWQLMERTEAAERSALEAARGHATTMSHETASTLLQVRQLLQFLANRSEMRQMAPAPCATLLKGLLQIDLIYANVALIAPDGTPVCSSAIGPGPVTGNTSNFHWFKQIVGGADFAYGRAGIGAVVRRPVLAIAHGMRDASGQLQGVLMVTLDLIRWSEDWVRLALPPGSVIVLQDEAGRIIGRFPEPQPWIGRDVPEMLERFRSQYPDGAGLGTGLDNVPRYYALARVPDQPWVVIAGMPAAPLQEVASAERRQLLISGAAIVLATLLLAGLMAARLAAPLSRLARTARAVAGGERTARAPLMGSSEFNTVAREFNRMLDAQDLSEAQLRESERRYRDMLDHMELLALACDLEGRVNYCNDWLLRTAGWQREELVGQDWLATLLEPVDAAALRTALRAQALPHHSELLLRTRHDDQRLIRWNHTMLRAPDGQIIGAASVGEDITEQHAAQRRADRLGRFYAALTQTNQAIVNATSAEQLLTEICRVCVSAGQARMACVGLLEGTRLRLAASSEKGLEHYGGMPRPFDLANEDDAYSNSGQVFVCGQRQICNDYLTDGRSRPWYERAAEARVAALAAFPLRRGGVVVGVLTVYASERDFFDAALVELLDEMALDLSHALERFETDALRRAALTRAQQEQQAAELARTAQIIAEAASQAKTEFLSRISHELRTPLNAVLGFAQLLELDMRNPLSPHQQTQVQRIRDAGGHLLALINDTLDVSAAEAGRLRVQQQRVELALLLDEVLALSGPLATDAHIELLANYRPQGDALAAQADALRLRQVVLNLLSNAIKYGGSRVELRLSAHDGQQVLIEIEDDGLGMDAEQLARLFEPFDRLGREAGSVEGKGIGMALTQQLMELMGGRIEVLSQPGLGTCVRLLLKAAPAQ